MQGKVGLHEACSFGIEAYHEQLSLSGHLLKPRCPEPGILS